MKNYFYLAAIAIGLSSCYSHAYTMGSGAQTGITIKHKNVYVIGGLVNLKTADPQAMAGDAPDFTVNTKTSFVDGLIQGLTFGIVQLQTVTVQK